VRIALLSTQAALPGDVAGGSAWGRHVGHVARMLRFLGHECLLIGVAERPPIGGPRGHARGTRARLLQDVPVGADGGRELVGLDTLLDEEHPDVIWLLERRGARHMLEAARSRSIPVVADLHGLSCPTDLALDTRPPGREGADELRYLLAGADAVVVHLRSDRAAVEREGIGNGGIRDVHVHLIPFGAELCPPVSVPAARNASNGTLTVGFAGPLIPSGGAHVLLQALALMPGLPLRVRVEGIRAGDKEYEKRLSALAAADPRAVIAVKPDGNGHGAWPHEPERPAGGPDGGPVDLLVAPSLAPACPIVCLDAIGQGIPVVASDESCLAALLRPRGAAGDAGGTGLPAGEAAGAPNESPGSGASDAVRDSRAFEAFRAGDAAALARVLERLCAAPESVVRLRSALALPPGIEEEALEMERLTHRLLDPDGMGSMRSGEHPDRRGRRDRDRVSQRGGEPTRLVGGGIDFPHHMTDIPRTAVQLTGWALCAPQPVARVEVLLNGEPVGRARLGLARPVLLGAFAEPEMAVCGFEHWIDLTALGDGVRRVRFDVVIVALDGSRFPLAPIEVGVDPARQPSPEDVERIRVLAERVQRFARPPKRGRRAADANGEYHVRLAAFGHGLGYGGAQLYLFELLRQLAAEPWFTCTVVSPSDGPLRKDYEALGIAVHVTDFPRVTEVDLYEGNQIEFAAWLRNEGCNVVLGNTLLAFPWMDLAARIGIPSVWAIHESYDLSIFWAIHLPHVAIHPHVGDRVANALGSAAALVFEADATRRMFEPFADARRLVKVDYGIDVEGIRRWRASADRTELRSRLGIPQDATVILCLGAIEPRKSQTMLAQAFGTVGGIADAHPEAFLVLVGDMGGEYARSLKEYLEAAGLAHRSRVVPVVADTYPWYGVADLFALPSDLESLPRSVLEAMAFELPVAAAGAFGLPELIEDGHSGYLCEPRDLVALSEMLGRVLAETPEGRRRVGRAGARLVAERHDSAAYAAAFGRLMRALVHNPDALPGDVLAAPTA
jgi:glycosyltransferase involved in cell wall biosynthesis